MSGPLYFRQIWNESKYFTSSGTDEDRAKREPSLCNESVNGHFWTNLCLNCIFKSTWFVKTDIWSVIDRSRVRFPVEAALIIFLFYSISLSFLTRFLFCSTRISKADKCAAFQLWTPTYFTEFFPIFAVDPTYKMHEWCKTQFVDLLRAKPS